MARDIWKHGKYLDLWSLVHFLSGVLLASFFYHLNLDLFWSATFSLIALLGWEFFESVLGIIETTSNVVVDIIIGFVGFLLFAHLLIGHKETRFILPVFPAIWVFNALALNEGLKHYRAQKIFRKY